jgi:hypothetical protein
MSLVFGHSFYLSIQHVLKQNPEGFPGLIRMPSYQTSRRMLFNRDIKGGGKSMYLDAGRKSMPRCAADVMEFSEQFNSVEFNPLTLFVSVWQFHAGYLPTYGRED